MMVLRNKQLNTKYHGVLLKWKNKNTLIKKIIPQNALSIYNVIKSNSKFPKSIPKKISMLLLTIKLKKNSVCLSGSVYKILRTKFHKKRKLKRKKLKTKMK